MPPVLIRAGSVAVKIYKVVSGPRVAWEVRDHFGGRGHTHRRKFASKAAAQLYARERAAMMANASSARHRLTEQQAYDCERAMDILKPLGKGLLQLAYEEKARWEIESKLRVAESFPVAKVVEEFLAEKKRLQLGEYHLRDLKSRLGRFARDFQLPINRIDRTEIERWLNGLEDAQHRKIGACTWNNYRASLASFFGFAKTRKYLPADWNEIEGLDPVKIGRGRINIFTPENMTALLSACSDQLLPALAIAAFAGLRTEEILRLRWEDVKWGKGYIFLRAEITKTNRTRTVPIIETLADWLSPWKDARGRVCDLRNLGRAKSQLARGLGLKWSRNVLRHSWISYRVAILHDIARVAMEAGNSVAIIHAHYLELTTPVEAQKWFGIRPQNVTQNVLPLQFA